MLQPCALVIARALCVWRPWAQALSPLQDLLCPCCRLSRSQRKSLRRAERKPGPGNGGCSDTVPRSMEAMRLSPVDEPAGDAAEEGGDVEAAGV